MRAPWSWLVAAALGCAGEDGGGTSETDADHEGGGAPFLSAPDGGGSAFACDLWTQDCPAADKCMPWAPGGGESWTATRCTPLADEPAAPGEPCTVQGGATSGVDDCAARAMCWDVDDSGQGTCVAMCDGSPDAPSCADPQQGCSISNGGALVLCVPRCDPLAQDCPAGGACYPEDHGFFCSPDASEDLGARGDPCAYLNACDPGLWCAPQADVPGCAAESGCCSPICDPADPSACPDAGQVCVPYQGAGLCEIPD